MKKRIFRYVKHVFVTLTVLILVGSGIIIVMNGTLNYNQNSLRYNLEEEGPYIFYKNDSLVSVEYVK